MQIYYKNENNEFIKLDNYFIVAPLKNFPDETITTGQFTTALNKLAILAVAARNAENEFIKEFTNFAKVDRKEANEILREQIIKDNLGQANEEDLH